MEKSYQKFFRNLFESEIPTKKEKSMKRKQNLSESIAEFGISPQQYLFDKNVVKSLHDMSESVQEFRETRNDYFASQRDAALEAGFIEAAEYYDGRLR
jgi:hypothetical protein